MTVTYVSDCHCGRPATYDSGNQHNWKDEYKCNSCGISVNKPMNRKGAADAWNKIQEALKSKVTI